MSAQVIHLTDPFEIITCCNCGISFAVPGSVKRRWRNDEKIWFYCPMGHQQHYPGESEEQRLQKELAQERKRTEWARQDARQVRKRTEQVKHKLRAEKAAKTRIKNRIAHGVCPCCKRTFSQLARHMAAKHPDYRKAE